MMSVLPKKNDACTIQTSFMFYRVFNSCQGISDYVNCPIPHILLYTTGISSVKKTKKLQKDQRKKHCLSVFTKKTMICDLQYTFILKTY